MSRRTALYRFFDADDQLLYVGIAFDPRQRWREHHRRDFWELVARGTFEMFPSRPDAIEAEEVAIREEHPLHNKLLQAFPHVDLPPRPLSGPCGSWIPNSIGPERGTTRLACMRERKHEGRHRDSHGYEWYPGEAPHKPAVSVSKEDK